MNMQLIETYTRQAEQSSADIGAVLVLIDLLVQECKRLQKQIDEQEKRIDGLIRREAGI